MTAERMTYLQPTEAAGRALFRRAIAGDVVRGRDIREPAYANADSSLVKAPSTSAARFN